MRPGKDIQEEPESTIGQRPDELRAPAVPAAAQAPGAQSFAGERVRRDEGEESEAGEEIRAREEELTDADDDRDSAPIPLDEPEP